MPVVSASIRREVSRLMMTLMPLRVAKPFLPVVTGIVRMTLPFFVTVSVCLLTSTVLMTADPIVKFFVDPVCLPHTPGASSTLPSDALTVTFVPVFQYSFGRHCTWDDENQRQPPSVAGVVVTDRPLSAASRFFTDFEKSTMIGMPTP